MEIVKILVLLSLLVLLVGCDKEVVNSNEPSDILSDLPKSLTINDVLGDKAMNGLVESCVSARTDIVYDEVNVVVDENKVTFTYSELCIGDSPGASTIAFCYTLDLNNV